jgi:hypothetical protein
MTKARQADLLTAIRDLGFKEDIGNVVRTNPFSQVSRVLCPQAGMLYDFITTKKFVCGQDYTRSQWDNARYLFLENWPGEYYDLLD